MAVAYDLALTYCSEADVFRYAEYTFGTDSAPTDQQVYEYTQDVAAVIEAVTLRAGNQLSPTAAQSATAYIRRLLEQANASGAAMLARHSIFTATGSSRDERILEALARRYESLMGEGASGGGTVAGVGTGGTLPDAIAGESGANLLANEVTEGEVVLENLSGSRALTDVEPAFTTRDVD